jgi:hypothetical protein
MGRKKGFLARLSEMIGPVFTLVENRTLKKATPYSRRCFRNPASLRATMRGAGAVHGGDEEGFAMQPQCGAWQRVLPAASRFAVSRSAALSLCSAGFASRHVPVLPLLHRASQRSGSDPT